ncbi:UNVERIFIED_CONTAM: hypothetical protein HDU68_006068 [Siphonaria sp. JEL0065]|nr:hypothetical protein HDU68_006068 [Siphonaria sp. JEL0065]
MSSDSKGSSWFANGSSALTSGFSLVSAIVNEVSHAVPLGEDRDIDDDDSADRSLPSDNQIAQLQAEFRKQLEARDVHIKALEKQITSFRANPSSPSLPTPTSATTANSTDLEERNQQLQEKLMKAVGHLKPLVEENRALKAKVAELEAQSISSNSTPTDTTATDSLRNEIKSLTSTIESLHVEKKTLTESLLHAETEIQSLSTELNAIKAEKSGWDTHRVELVELQESLTRKHAADLEKLVQDSRASDTQYLGVLEREKRRVSLLEAEKELVDRELGDSKGLVGRLEAEIGALKEQVAAAASSVASRTNNDAVVQELESVKESHATTAKSLQQAQEKITKLATKLKHTLETNQSLQKQLKSAIESSDLQSQLSVLQAQLESTQSMLAASQARESELLKHVQDLESSVTASATQPPPSSTNNLESKIETLTEDLEFLKSEIEELSSTNSTLSKSLKESQETNSTLNSSLREALQLKDTLQQQLDEAIASASAKGGDTDRWGDIPTSATEEIAPAGASLELELSLQTLKTENESLKQQVSTLESKAEKLVKKLAQTAESSQELSSQIDELSATLQQHVESISVLEAAKSGLEAHNSTLEGSVSALQGEKAELEARTSELEQQVIDSITRAEKLKYDFDFMEVANADKEGLISSLQAELESLKSAAFSATDSATIVQDLETKISFLTQETVTLSTQLETATESLTTATLQLSTCDSRSHELEAQLSTLKATETELHTKLQLLGQVAVLEKQEFDALRVQFDGVVDQVQEVVVLFIESLPAGTSDDVDVDSFDLMPLSLKGALNRLKVALGGVLVGVHEAHVVVPTADTSALDSVKAEYEQIMVDLNVELEDKNRAFHDLQTQFNTLTLEKEKVSGEYAILMDKLKTFKNTVAPKLQEEMESNKSLRAHVESLTQQVANLNDEKSLLKGEISELTAAIGSVQQEAATAIAAAQSAATSAENLYDNNNDVERLQEELAQLSAENEKLQRKLTALQHHLAESEEIYTQDLLRIQGTCDEYKLQLDSLERERETWEGMASESGAAVQMAEENAAEAQKDAMEARMLLEDAVKGRERDLVSLNNLQSVLEEFQASKEAEIELAIETITKQLNSATQSLQEYKARALAAETQLSEIDQSSLPNAQEVQLQLQEKTAEIGKLRGRVISLETYLSEAIRRAASADNQVDRRLVSNLIVSFLSAPRGDSKRFEMLTVIASVLKLTDEDKVKIGLLRKIGGTGVGGGSARSPAGGAAGESFTDLWISFLIKEAGTAEKPQQGSNSVAGATGAEDVAGSVVPQAESDVTLTNGSGVPKRPSSTMGFFGGWGGDKKSS